MLDPTVAPQLNQWRRELGLPPVTRVFRDWIHSPQRVIGLFPDWFGVPQPDWPASLRLTGFPLFDDHGSTDLPASLSKFLDGGPPPLLFTPAARIRLRRDSSRQLSKQARVSDAGRFCLRATRDTFQRFHRPPITSRSYRWPTSSRVVRLSSATAALARWRKDWPQAFRS